MKKILLFVLSVVVFASCYTTRTTVGNYTQLEQQGLKTYKYDQVKQFYLFGGLIPIGHSHARTPNEPCEIKAKFGLGDFIISALTCEIISTRTIRVYAFDGGSSYPLETPSAPAPAVSKKEQVVANEEIAQVEQKTEPEKQAKKQEKKKEIIAEQPQNITESEPVVIEKKTKKQAEKTTQKETPEKQQEVASSITPKSEPEQPAIIPAKEPELSPVEVEPVIKEEPVVVKEEPVATPIASSSTTIEKGAIMAPFTVGASKKVYFSKGNLQYQASSKTWRFAEQQYEAIGASNSNISPSNSGWIDLFGWGTSGWYNRNTFYMPYDTESASATYGYGYGPTDGQTYEYSLRGKYAEADWGVANVISDAGDSAGMWRTLTRAEWGYLLLKRPNAASLYSLAVVNGVKGLLVLPDDWTCPSGLNFIARTSFELNTYTLEQWKKLESHGAVFLPSAGCRYGTTVGNVGTTGSYWTASASGGENAWYFVFNKGKIDILSDFSRALGRSVRLVQDIK